MGTGGFAPRPSPALHKQLHSMPCMIEILNEIKLNVDTTEYMCIKEQQEKIQTGTANMKVCNTFKFLGSIIISNG